MGGTQGNRSVCSALSNAIRATRNHDDLHNLIWVWEASPTGPGPNANGQYGEFSPGLLYVDALALNLSQANTRFPPDSSLKLLGNGKVVGLFVSGAIPDPEFFTRQTDWAWFLFASNSMDQNNTVENRAQKVRKLYSDPRMLSR